MFYYPEMKQNLISSIKIVVYKLPQEFSNDFQKSYNLRKLGDIRKTSKASSDVFEFPVSTPYLNF